ncbi:MAG: homoserine dehydrogenase [Deltaproteobacteria bacterium]|nr:homoserine dehydrogenase [Deltaproteobacteria bacterium]
METINVGLIGFGTIGSGVVKLLEESREVIRERVGADVVLKRIADKDITSRREVEVESSLLTQDASDIIDDPDISIVIELVGGTDVAKSFLLSAVDRGKSVVTANKALLSTYGAEIFERVVQKGVDIGFEASVGGGIPVIQALREGLAGNRIESIYGIINGTANYILSTMTHEGRPFGEILKEAQESGYAEADPTYDIEGVDTAHKLAILVNLAYGSSVGLDDIYTEGISRITPLDIQFAGEFGYRIKLLAIAKEMEGKVEMRVHPTMIPDDHPLATVEGVYNAVHLVGSAVGSVILYGKGAGMMPTASAVVGDVINICRNMKMGATGRVAPLSYLQENIKPIELKKIDELDVPYYLRFSAIDRPGVLSKIAGVLGGYNISIASVIQKGRRVGDAVPLVIKTHHAKEWELMSALTEIDGMEVIADKTQYIRIEENLGAEI